MDEERDQASHESNDNKKVNRPSSKREIDWDTGFALYCQGRTAGFIGKAIGVRRESVQRHIADDGWKTKRDKARTISDAHGAPLQLKDIVANEVVARELDAAASELISLVRLQVERCRELPIVGADTLQKLTYALARAGQLRRQSRGMAPLEGFAPKQDNRLELVIRRLPATKAEYDASKPAAAEPQEVPT